MGAITLAVRATAAFRNVLPRGVSTSVEDGVTPGAIPSMLAIGSVVPNPFNPRTTIFMDLPRDAGRHAVTWEDTDAAGRRVASGVYVVRMTTADGEQRMQKITLAESSAPENPPTVACTRGRPGALLVRSVRERADLGLLLADEPDHAGLD